MAVLQSVLLIPPVILPGRGGGTPSITKLTPDMKLNLKSVRHYFILLIIDLGMGPKYRGYLNNSITSYLSFFLQILSS